MARSGDEFMDLRVTNTATITSGSATSSEVDLGGTRMIAIRFPTVPHTAGFGFDVSYDSGSNYSSLTNNLGVAYSVSSSGNEFIYVDPEIWRPVRWFRILSGTSETASRTIHMVSVPTP